MNNEDLMKYCNDFPIILSDVELKCINGIELYDELVILKNMIDDNKYYKLYHCRTKLHVRFQILISH